MTKAPDSGILSKNQEIISRADAKSRGIVRYFTGKSCKHGHIAERYLINNRCTVCSYNSYDSLKAKEYYQKNSEKIKKRSQDWTKNNKERKSEAAKKSYKEKRSKIIKKLPQERYEISRRYYENNKFACLARNAKWRNENKAKTKVYKSERRARMQNADGFHTSEQIEAMLVKQSHKCIICNSSIKKSYHVDHIIPLMLGGSNWISNIQLLCAPCNLRKNKKDPIKFAQENGRLL